MAGEHEDIDFELNELGRKPLAAFAFPSNSDTQPGCSFSFDVTEISESLSERVHQGRILGIATR